MPQWLDSLKTRLGLEDEEAPAEQSLLQQIRSETTLDRTQRAIGFAVCVGIGLLLSFMVGCGSGAGAGCDAHPSGGGAVIGGHSRAHALAGPISCPAGAHVHLQARGGQRMFNGMSTGPRV